MKERYFTLTALVAVPVAEDVSDEAVTDWMQDWMQDKVEAMASELKGRVVNEVLAVRQ